MGFDFHVTSRWTRAADRESNTNARCGIPHSHNIARMQRIELPWLPDQGRPLFRMRPGWITCLVIDVLEEWAAVRPGEKLRTLAICR